MSSVRRLAWMFGLCALLARPAPLRAQGPAERADALFKEGRQLFDKRSYEEACPKLEESDRLRPTVKSIGLLAACHEEQGRTATAWREYRETAARAHAAKDDREAFARGRAAALEPKLPRANIRLARPAPGVEVTRNGEPVPEADLGKDVYVDPGTLDVTARAPQKRPWRASFTLAPGAVQVIEIPALADDPAANPFVDPLPPPGPGGLRIAGFIAGGVGLAAMGVGAGFGLAAIGKNDDSNEMGCTENLCDATGAALRNDARDLAMASNIGFGVGIAGLGAGVVLLLLSSGEADAPKEPRALRVAPTAGPGGAGAVVSASF